MRFWKTLVAGVLALGGLAFVQGEASARPMTPPALIQPAANAAATGTEAPNCQYYRHRWHPGYGWHHRGWGRPYGFYRPYGFHRPYGFYRPYGFHRYYGWHRPYGFYHPHRFYHSYGWRRRW